MKIVAAAIVAVAAMLWVTGSMCEVNAAGDPNSRKRHIKRHYTEYAVRRYKPAYPDASGWFPHDANQLQFGSALWWDQMRREGRINR